MLQLQGQKQGQQSFCLWSPRGQRDNCSENSLRCAQEVSTVDDRLYIFRMAMAIVTTADYGYAGGVACSVTMTVDNET